MANQQAAPHRRPVAMDTPDITDELEDADVTLTSAKLVSVKGSYVFIPTFETSKYDNVELFPANVLYGGNDNENG